MLVDKQNTYVFKVDGGTSKSIIKNEVEKQFGVKVEAVRTFNQRGKVKRQHSRRSTYKRSDFKKAYVTLKSGDKIDIFEKGK